MTQQRAGLDLELMRRAIEGLDAEALARLYADEAEMLTVNRYSSPSSPKVLREKDEISEHPDGTKVLCAATLELRDGRVVEPPNVEAWDE